jgi:hypothetical protein
MSNILFRYPNHWDLFRVQGTTRAKQRRFPRRNLQRALGFLSLFPGFLKK